ncbi:MAG: hypothetical protein ACTSQQ_06980, partial [Candidatus Helarchaeota archaeon]
MESQNKTKKIKKKKGSCSKIPRNKIKIIQTSINYSANSKPMAVDSLKKGYIQLGDRGRYCLKNR